MASTAVAAHEYWGYLIKPDKSPTPVFEQLLLGVAHYINRHIAPWDIQTLTPAKLAAFYRLVGGDYDPLFLDTSQASLSFIYQSLGCYHTLQPEKDPYTPPTIPALTPAGFVRWQTVQLLLEPEEHVPFLQEAVKRFDLMNPADGAPFPSILPKQSLPCQPDMEMVEWHEIVAEKLMLEAQASAARAMPPRPNLVMSDMDLESSRDTSSVDSHSVVDAAHGAGYFYHPRANNRGPPFVQVPYRVHSPSSPSGPRRHSTSVSPQRRAQGYPSKQRQPSSPSPSKPKNVRWQDMDDVFDAPRHNIPRNRSMDLRGRGDPRNEYRGEDQRRGARSVGPMTGVGGRRYARSGSGMDWR
ncbi:MAG: hypothetical protein Q9175_001747 [Cornicularia normoerica]